MDKMEMKQQARMLQAKMLELTVVRGRLEEALNHLRAACPHDPKALPGSGIIVCDTCGAKLDGCLASLDGCCHYEEGSDLCLFCDQEKHAVQMVPR
jgi:hypothetical protein